MSWWRCAPPLRGLVFRLSGQKGANMRRMSFLIAVLAAAAIGLSPLSEAVARGGGSHSGGGHSGSGGSHAVPHSSVHASGGLRASRSSGASHAGTSKESGKTASARSKTHTASTSGKHTSRYSQVAARDQHGRIARSEHAKSDFKKSHPCPSTGKSSGACRGYVIDHVQPLKRGGADSPSNMQWQTKQAAKEKNRTE